jgi:hypothetical protein
VRIISRMQEKIAANYPGTGIAISEYNNGGDGSIAGTIAEADSLGVFGQMGVYEASYWPMSDYPEFIQAAFRAYRDYDGSLSAFGDISVPAVSSDTSKVAAYISLDSRDANRCVIVAINRSNAAQAVNFSGVTFAGTARYFRLSTVRTTPVLVGEGSLDLSSDIIPLPAYSVTTVEITGNVGGYDQKWARCNESSTEDRYDSPWYGWFYKSADTGDWVCGDINGWQYVWDTANAGSVYLYDSGTASWWWTCADFWPYFYDFADGSWCFYYSGVCPSRRFYNFKTNSVVNESGMPREY